MAGNIPTDYRVGDSVCTQDGGCGEVVAASEGGVELKLDDGKGLSVPTGNLDHDTLYTAPLSDAVITYRNLTELNPKPLVGLYRKLEKAAPEVGIYIETSESIRHVLTPDEKEKFVEAVRANIIERMAKPAEPLKDTPIQHTREFNGEDWYAPLSSGIDRALRVDESRPKRSEEGLRGESIRHALTPEQVKTFEEAVKIYIKNMAKPADAERLSGESIRPLITQKEVKQFTEAIEIYLKKNGKPADAERFSESAKTLLWDIQKDGRGSGEERPALEYIERINIPEFTPAQIEHLKDLIDEKLRAAKKKE